MPPVVLSRLFCRGCACAFVICEYIILFYVMAASTPFMDGTINSDSLEGENWWRSVVQELGDIVSIHDPQGCFRYITPTVTRVLGYSVDSLIGKTWFDFVHPEDLRGLKAAFESVLHRTNKGHPVPFRLRNAQGQWVQLESLGRNLMDHPDIKGIAVVTRDVSQRHQMELLLRRSEVQFRSVWEKSRDGMRLTDGSGTTLLVNQAFCELVDKPKESLEGRSLTEVYADFERTRILGAYLSRYRRKELCPNLEGKFTLWNGRVAWFAVTNSFLEPESDDSSVLSMFRDVTARKIAEVEKLELERRLLQTQKLESLVVLAGGVAHDFNNLLTSILGNLELAMMDTPQLSNARESIEGAAQATRKAAELSRQMLAYSGRGKFLVKELDLGSLVKEMTQLIEVSISKTAVLHLDLDENLPLIQADASQMRQILMNLVTNASEAIGDQSGGIAIRTGVRDCDEAYLSLSGISEKPAPGRYVFLEVADTGCGMDQTVQQRLFDPFFTTKFTGRGLGLSAVLGVVLGHRGAIMVSSELGAGAVIRVLFPVWQPETKADSKTSDRIVVAPVMPSTCTVLVVDDEDSVRKLTVRALQRLGYQTYSAADGLEAVQMFEIYKDEIGCVLMDLTMPKMDGLAAFAELKRLKPGVQVILSSGYDACEIGRRVEGQGFACFLQKPFELNSLLAEIRRICVRRE